MPLNIKDFFLQLNKKFILFVSYSPGFKLDNFRSVFENDLGLLPMTLNCDEMYPKNIDFINFDDLNLKINEKIKNLDTLKSNILCYVIYSLSFPKKKINFHYDLHIHLSVKSKLFYETLIIDKIVGVSPEYLKNSEKFLDDNIINKYYNIQSYDDNDVDDILNKIFDFVVQFWEKNIYGKKYKLFAPKNIINQHQNNNNINDDNDDNDNNN